MIRVSRSRCLIVRVSLLDDDVPVGRERRHVGVFPTLQLHLKKTTKAKQKRKENTRNTHKKRNGNENHSGNENENEK